MFFLRSARLGWAHLRGWRAWRRAWAAEGAVVSVAPFVARYVPNGGISCDRGL